MCVWVHDALDLSALDMSVAQHIKPNLLLSSLFAFICVPCNNTDSVECAGMSSE